jgi:hypothetical protein
MTEITLILKDENGTQTRRTFGLAGDLDSLDGIDEAVEEFKRQALPQIEQELLTQAHDRVVAQEKKTVFAR